MLRARWIALLAASALALVLSHRPASSSAAYGTLATPFPIQWTAPGNDSLSGQASVYDLRYLDVPLTASNFHQATPVAGLPAPAVAGSPESFVVPGLPDGVPVYLAIKSSDAAGNWSTISNVLFRPVATTGVDAPELTCSFSSSWPNPARVSVNWAYAIPQAAHVQVDVFDVTGRHVHTVTSGERSAGRGDLSWDLADDQGRPAGAGLYFVKARLGSMQWTKRLIIVR